LVPRRTAADVNGLPRKFEAPDQEPFCGTPGRTLAACFGQAMKAGCADPG
jgi:hypothetical protein